VQPVRDYAPASWRRMVIIRQRLERFLDRRGYAVVGTPVLESTDLFLRKSGGELASRMYSFTDPSGHQRSLRPEFTSSVVRAFIDGTLSGPAPQRWQYCGPVFRYEGPGEGGLEFQQLGAELLSAGGPAADAEVVAVAAQGLTALGVKGHRVRVGHVGVVSAMLAGLGLPERARVFVLGSLGALRSGADGMRQVRARAAELGLLDEGRRRAITRIARSMAPADAEGMVKGFLAAGVDGHTGQRTPEEIFTRYLKKLQEASVPEVMERALRMAAELVELTGPATRTRSRLGKLVASYGLDESVLEPLDALLGALAHYDLKGVPVQLDLGLARGIAYYTGVVFNVDHPRVTGTPSLGGGGRYDGLVTALGGAQDVPALGFAYSLEQVSALLPADFGADEDEGQMRVLVVSLEGSQDEAVATAERLRAQGIPAELDLGGLRTDVETARYAKARGIGTVMRVGRDGDVAETRL
jgi:histidyl-tRNA synthetase